MRLWLSRSLAAHMHITATGERYHETLRRLAVVLLMLAGIAERAACRSWPMRSVLLWLLTKAEKRVHGYAGRAGVPLFPAKYGASLIGDEAARLARGFRALATAFFALSRRVSQRLGRRHHWLLGRRRNTPWPGRVFVAEVYADTS
jgi:hypothetical protein